MAPHRPSPDIRNCLRHKVAAPSSDDRNSISLTAFSRLGACFASSIPEILTWVPRSSVFGNRMRTEAAHSLLFRLLVVGLHLTHVIGVAQSNVAFPGIDGFYLRAIVTGGGVGPGWLLHLPAKSGLLLRRDARSSKRSDRWYNRAGLNGCRCDLSISDRPALHM